jgi:hypothetical protein
MNEPANDTELAIFAAICEEAARCHGDNWPAVEGHIINRVSTLSKDQRERLAKAVDRVLRYRSPNADSQTQ